MASYPGSFGWRVTLDEEWLGARNIPKILEAELLSFPLGGAPRDAIRIFVGSNKAFALFTTLTRACSSPTVRNCGRRSVLLAVPRRDCRQGLRARRFSRDTRPGQRPAILAVIPVLGSVRLSGRARDCSVSPTGRRLGGGGGGGVLFQVHSYLTGKWH